MRTIGIDTSDEYLARRIELELRDKFKTVRISDTADAAGCDSIIRDTDTGKAVRSACRIITVSRTGDAELLLPYPLGALEELLCKKVTGAYLSLDGEHRCAYVGGRTVKLSELEYSLLSLLIRGGGSFVSRDEIRESVWGKNAENGLINIYIHYLREKLERGGERIIICSRKSGYAIDGRFLGGEPFAETY